jgi:RNA polymerase sigma-70 factor (ECF subfamily)
MTGHKSAAMPERAAAAPIEGAEPAALDAFVREHYPRLIRLAGLVTRDVDQAQDAVQAALERAWRKHHGLRDRSTLRPWLDRIVVREAIRQTQPGPLRRMFNRPATDWTDIPASLPEPEERAAVREAVGRLSPGHRAVVALHLYAGYTVEETARLLEIPIDTVRSRLRTARDHLRRHLGGGAP